MSWYAVGFAKGKPRVCGWFASLFDAEQSDSTDKIYTDAEMFANPELREAYERHLEDPEGEAQMTRLDQTLDTWATDLRPRLEEDLKSLESDRLYLTEDAATPEGAFVDDAITTLRSLEERLTVVLGDWSGLQWWEGPDCAYKAERRSRSEAKMQAIEEARQTEVV